MIQSYINYPKAFQISYYPDCTLSISRKEHLPLGTEGLIERSNFPYGLLYARVLLV